MERSNDRPAHGMYEMQFPVPDVGGDNGGLTLVVALQGYADAGMAVANSASHLLDSLEHRPLVVFNNDELVDYRSRRPSVTMVGDEIASMTELELSLQVVKDNEGVPFLLLSGPEPDLRWDAFSAAVVDLAEKFNVTRALSLYSAPMTVPHTRPMGLIAHGNDRKVLRGHRAWGQKVTVPGAASLRLELEMNRRGRKSCGFTAQVPHYVAHGEYPLATLRLLEAVADASGLALPLAALESEAEQVRQMLAEQVEDSNEVTRVVSMLEQQYDEEEQRRSILAANPLIGPDGQIASADELGAEFEKFLASQLGSSREDVGVQADTEEVDELGEFDRADGSAEASETSDSAGVDETGVTKDAADGVADDSADDADDEDRPSKKRRRGPRLPWFRF